jgi:hypothetical protein
VHSQSDLVQQGYTQTHLGLGTPKWPSASWMTDFIKPCVLVLTAGWSHSEGYFWIPTFRALSTSHL